MHLNRDELHDELTHNSRRGDIPFTVIIRISVEVIIVPYVPQNGYEDYVLRVTQTN